MIGKITLTEAQRKAFAKRIKSASNALYVASELHGGNRPPLIAELDSIATFIETDQPSEWCACKEPLVTVARNGPGPLDYSNPYCSRCFKPVREG